MGEIEHAHTANPKSRTEHSIDKRVFPVFAPPTAYQISQLWHAGTR